MENPNKPNWSENLCRWCGYAAVIFYIEFIGTFVLVAAINATKGEAAGIGLTLFFLLVFGA
jgi:hypothetical protein